MANPAPLPPTVSGPIYTTSTQVLVNNVFPNSTVKVYETGISAPIGTATTTATSPTSISVPMTTSLLHDTQQITATQEYTGTDPSILKLVAANVESARSGPVTVVNAPEPLPAPIFASGLCTCMDWVYIDGLIPGATLTITMGGTPMVTAVAVTQSPQWFQLAAVPIHAGSVLVAQQTLGASKSPTTTSSPPIEVAPALGAPVIKPQPLDCQTNLSLSNLVPGADLKVINGAIESFATNTWSSMDLVGLAPLQVAASSAQQYFTRCDQKQAPVAPFTVARQAPNQPQVTYPLCKDVTAVTVSDVVAGEILILTVNYVPTTTPPTSVTTSLGACPVSGPGPISLPNNWYPAAAVAGSVTLQIVGSLCGTPGPSLSVPVVQPAGQPAPTVQQPVYECATSVFIEGATPGSAVQVWSVRPPAPAIPRSNSVRATQANFAVGLWWPLTPADIGAQIYVTQTGCNANQPSKHVPVLAPPKLTIPTVAGNNGYVLPTDTSVLVNNVVPGARVTLLLNGAPESQVDSIQVETGLPSGTPPLVTIRVPVGSLLKVGDVLAAGQTLCSSAFPSPGQGGGVPVQAPVPAPTSGPGEPGGGLGSNNNYFMFQPSGTGCANLLNVTVKIQVTEAIVWVSTGAAPPGCPAAPPTGTPGLSLQLNCYSPKSKSSNPLYPNWQQYIINLWGTQLLGAINTWNTFSNVVIFPGSEYTTPLGPAVPTAGTLPVGIYEIILGNDASGNVNSVAWVVNGVKYTPSPATIPALLVANGLSANDIAPIVAFTLNLVGPVNAESAVLSSGAGIITYSAASALTVTNGEPTACVEGITGFTCERASSSYGPLPANPANPFSQTFAVSATTPLIRRMRGRPLVRK